MGTEIIVALIAGLITIIGWVVTYILAKKREDQSRKAQSALRHLERQIEELYGPLDGLLTYSGTVFRLEQTRKEKRSPEQAGKDPEVIRYFIENHYIPLNQQIMTLLRTKPHLIADDKMPESFKIFIERAAYLECLHKLWLNTKIDSPFMAAPGGANWASEFHDQVSQKLQELRTKHSELIQDITGRKLLKEKRGL